MSAETFRELTKCLDLTEEHIGAAVESREETRALLEHLASIAKPEEGAPKVLRVFVRLVEDRVEWLDGDLHVELTSKGASTSIDLSLDLGVGTQERLFPPLEFGVALNEFEVSIEKYRWLVGPFVMTHEVGKVTLATPDEARRSVAPAPRVGLSRSSLTPPAFDDPDFMVTPEETQALGPADQTMEVQVPSLPPSSQAFADNESPTADRKVPRIPK